MRKESVSRGCREIQQPGLCRDALLASEHLRDSHRLGSPAPIRVYGPTRAATRLALASFVAAPATLGHRDVSRPLATGARKNETRSKIGAKSSHVRIHQFYQSEDCAI